MIIELHEPANVLLVTTVVLCQNVLVFLLYAFMQGPAVLQWWQTALCSSTNWTVLQE